MVRRKTALIESIEGQHLNLCVAAHLGRTQLVANPLTRYDTEHLMEMVEAVARALAKVATYLVGSEP